MKRRTFLQSTGLALAGGTRAMAEGKPAPQPASAGAAPSVLITSADTDLAQAIARGLVGTYRITLSSASDVQSDYPFTKCDFSDVDATAALVRGMSAIVHVDEPLQRGSGASLIDQRTRGTYHLFQAAVRERVTGLVYLSSLDVMAGYGEAYQVNEDWCPRPTSDPRSMSHYLGEFTCREFAREGGVRVCVLRLGHIVRAEQTGGREDALRLDEPDAVRAVSRALAALVSKGARLGTWSVFHILSDARSDRFPMTRASQSLDYRPQSAG